MINYTTRTYRIRKEHDIAVKKMSKILTKKEKTNISESAIIRQAIEKLAKNVIKNKV